MVLVKGFYLFDRRFLRRRRASLRSALAGWDARPDTRLAKMFRQRGNRCFRANVERAHELFLDLGKFFRRKRGRLSCSAINESTSGKSLRRHFAVRLSVSLPTLKRSVGADAIQFIAITNLSSSSSLCRGACRSTWRWQCCRRGSPNPRRAGKRAR